MLLHRKLLDRLQGWQGAVDGLPAAPRGDWWVIIDFLRKTDQNLLARVSRRMINYLCWDGIAEAQDLLPRFTGGRGGPEEAGGENRPVERRGIDLLVKVADEVFRIAAEHLSPDEILSCIQKWIRDDKTGFLIEAVENQGTSVMEIAQALGRFRHAAIDDHDLSRTIQVELRVSLIRRFLTDNLDFLNTAKNYIEVSDFYDLSRRIICPPKSHGKLGGKSSGLFLAAQIVKKSPEYAAALGNIKIPRTWYITSDGVLNFIEFNHLEDLYNRKYLEIEQVRREYPHVVQVFKNSHFSPEIVKGLALALDDFEGRPLIVRSSSLLEDRVGSAFSGKYKSLFLANQGTKSERLSALMDAVAEVYASIFGPDPIEYRAERGLLDLHEEMGVMIQEVVGSRVGKYFFPTFAGVAFSNNEFRWSARIKRDDGLVRMVPGLGTRAVDRVGDDYPVLIAPGQPGLRANVTPDEVVRYSPTKMDVINLESGRFETVLLKDILAECGAEIPGVQHLLSLADEGGIHRPVLIDWGSDAGRLVATFEGLTSSTPFIAQMRALLRLLKEKTGNPVDIEFASDGKDLYLLQCRPQSFGEDVASAPIPSDLPADRVIFEARRFVSNGRIRDITHIVYVDPERYSALPDVDSLRRVGRAVGRLNKVLPKRQFVLMGPGRWGSRGDIRLGVPVTYSDINNTAVLIEIARKRGNYVPDLSFGTHFFQDLVEASIRYLPLFPDDPDIAFQERFLRESPNILADVAPEFADLEGTVRVIDVPRAAAGLVLRILLNADSGARRRLPGEPRTRRGSRRRRGSGVRSRFSRKTTPAGACEWPSASPASADCARFGIRAVYLFGSAKNGTAGAGSDINLLVHFSGTAQMLSDMLAWLEGWSLCLSETNYLRTGVKTSGLLDVHVLTDEDLESPSGYAAKIGAVTDAARPLPLRQTS